MHPDGRGPTSLAARVRAHAERAPDALFCTVLTRGNVQTLTFEQLYRGGCAYAAEFGRRGVGPGHIVPIILHHGPHLLYSFLGALLAGAIPSFMPFPSAKQRIDIYWKDHETLFNRLRPRMIVTYAENAAAAGESLAEPIEMLVAGDDILSVPAGESGFPGLTALVDEVACLQHSSGTTGLKKGVMLTHRAILDHVATYTRTLDFGAGDSIVSWLPLYHDMGFIACFMTSLLEGTPLVALDPFEWVMRPASLLDAIQLYRPTFCWLPNFAFSHIVRTTKATATYDLHSIRAVINCSEPCKAETFRRFAERFAAAGIDAAKLQVCYAMAENVFAVSQTSLGRPVTVLNVDPDAFSRDRVRMIGSDEPGQAVVSCGKLIDGVRVQIRGADNNVLPAGEIGEIRLSSPFSFSGYYLQPELTQKKLHDGWYATGDLGFIHEGELYVSGRVDDMIIVNGRNYYAHEIEAIVSDIDGIIPGRCTAVAVDDAASDATGVVILAECREPGPNDDLTSRAIREGVLDRLGFAVHSVLLLPAGVLVKTTSGKISRSKNKELYLLGEFGNMMVNR